MALRAWPVCGIVALILVATPSAAQNSPDDECIIQVALDDDLHTVRMFIDHLFNDTQWEAFTNQVDTNRDGSIDSEEVAAYENNSHNAMAWGGVPPERWVNLGYGWSGGPSSGDTFVVAKETTNRTDLIDFEGPVTERDGKTVREHWTYSFPTLEEATGSAGRLHSMQVKWGPDAREDPESSVVVIEVVQAVAPNGWHVAVGDSKSPAYTFERDDPRRYSITFRPNETPPDGGGFNGVPAPGLVAAAAVLGVATLWRRQRLL